MQCYYKKAFLKNKQQHKLNLQCNFNNFILHQHNNCQVTDEKIILLFYHLLRSEAIDHQCVIL